MNQATVYIQTGLLAGIFVLLVLVLSGMPDGLSQGQVVPPETRTDVLLEPLDRLRSTLDALPEKLRLAVPGQTERQPVVDNTELSKLMAQLGRLENVMRQRSAIAATVPARDAGQPPAWDRIAPLAKTRAALKNAELEAFKRKFFLWDESELLARFGVPTEINVHTSGTERWKYRNRTRELYLDFALHRGRVINVW